MSGLTSLNSPRRDLNITIITMTEVTYKCSSKISERQGNIQEILNRMFDSAMSFPNSLKLSSCFDSLQKFTYSQTWPKNTNDCMTINAFSPSNISILEVSIVYSLSDGDLFSLKYIYSHHFEKQFGHLLKIIHQKDDSDIRLERIT